jgi:glycosyltransferase involved in cell wall biosynthesis
MDGSADEPLVAVIIPVHVTPPQFLREAIESVRRQTERRWELVVALDAAAESCSSVALEMAALDPGRVAVVGEVGGTPRGASTARNRGVAHSRAPMLGFLDADDRLEPEWLRSRLALLEAHPAVAMVYGPSRYWYSWTGAESDQTRDFVPDPGIETHVVHPPPTLVTSLLDGTATVPVPCSILVRRWAFEAIGGFDETSRELYEDQALYASLGLRFPLLADDRVLDWYRQHPESMTARVSRPDGTRARWNYLDWLEREMMAAGIDDQAIRRAIDRERWKIRHPALARVLRLSRRAVARVLPLGRRGTPS